MGYAEVGGEVLGPEGTHGLPNRRGTLADRAELIGRLYAREDARWLAELLIDLEDDLGESRGYGWLTSFGRS